MNSILQNYEIYLGTISGALVHYTNNKNNNKVVYLRNEDKCEITALSWGRKPQEVLIGYKKGHSRIYNLATSKSKNIAALDKSCIIGIVPINDELLIATNSGTVQHWSKGKCSPFLKINGENKTIEKILINPYDENVLGVGGKSNDIKLYDITTQKTLFEAKCDRHDELELAQPVCVNGFTYIKNTSGKDLATVTRQGQIRLYDTRAQRRAVKIYKNSDSTYTTISETSAENEIVVGSSKGYLQVMDLRAQIKPIKTFKGYMGGLTDIACDLEEPIVASCSLDRHFRIHNLQEKKLEFEEYIKIQTPRLLMRKRHFISPKNEGGGEIEDVKEDNVEEVKEDDNEIEEIKEDIEDDEEENRKRRIKQAKKKAKKLKT